MVHVLGHPMIICAYFFPNLSNSFQQDVLNIFKLPLPPWMPCFSSDQINQVSLNSADPYQLFSQKPSDRYPYCFHSALKYILITGMLCVDKTKLRVSKVHNKRAKWPLIAHLSFV